MRRSNKVSQDGISEQNPAVSAGAGARDIDSAAARTPDSAAASAVETGDGDYIRTLNRGVVLSTIRKNEPISRAAIAKRTGLSRSTCSLIVDELIDRGLVSEVGKGESSGGRPGVLLTMNYDAGVTVGARLLADSVDCAIVDLRGEVVERRRTAVSYRAGVDEYIGTLVDAVSSILDSFSERFPGKPVFGLGLGLSGLVDSDAGESISSSILHWDHIPLADRVREALSIPVHIDNDVNTFAMGELWFGHGRGLDSFLCVTVGEGIGLGIVLNGEIYTGRHNGAGEFGHTRVSDDDDAPADAMGIRGSLEAFAADPAIRAYVRDSIAAGEPCSLAGSAPDGNPRAEEPSAGKPGAGNMQAGEMPAGDGSVETVTAAEGNQGAEAPDVEEIAEAARDGDALARRAYERAGRYLGIGVANLINLFDPELIVIGGEGCRARDLWSDAMERTIEENSAYGLDRRVRRIPIEYEDDVWVRGVASLVLKEVFEGRAAARPADNVSR